MPLPVATILYVEDDADDVFFFIRALEGQKVDCLVQTVSHVTGAKAYLSGAVPYDDRARFPLPAVLVTDMTMRSPGESSLDLIAWVRSSQEFATLRILCTTDNDQPSMIDAFASHGVPCHPKSGRMTEIAKAVKAALQEFHGS